MRRLASAEYKGPGDAHSNQEWVWQRARYQALFADAPHDALCGESTPFYLYNRDARRRIAADVPNVKLVAVLRDPVDRLYSNWMHLWVDGLEPCPDVVEACEQEQARIDAGWAPFWHYRSLGMYGRQVADLFNHVPRDQVLLVRYRELVEEPDETLDRVCGFLGVSTGQVRALPSDNSRPFVGQGPRTRLLGPVIRTGARLGAHLPPNVWRAASRPLVDRLHSTGENARPKLTPDQRHELLAVPPRLRAAGAGHRRVVRPVASPPRRRLLPLPPGRHGVRRQRLRPSCRSSHFHGNPRKGACGKAPLVPQTRPLGGRNVRGAGL